MILAGSARFLAAHTPPDANSPPSFKSLAGSAEVKPSTRKPTSRSTANPSTPNPIWPASTNPGMDVTLRETRRNVAMTP